MPRFSRAPSIKRSQLPTAAGVVGGCFFRSLQTSRQHRIGPYDQFSGIGESVARATGERPIYLTTLDVSLARCYLSLLHLAYKEGSRSVFQPPVANLCESARNYLLSSAGTSRWPRQDLRPSAASLIASLRPGSRSENPGDDRRQEQQRGHAGGHGV